MEPIGRSETSVFNNNKTPGEYPKELLSTLQHGESFKSRIPNSRINLAIIESFTAISNTSQTPTQVPSQQTIDLFPLVTQIHKFITTPTCYNAKQPAIILPRTQNFQWAQRCTRLNHGIARTTVAAESSRCVMQGILSTREMANRSPHLKKQSSLVSTSLALRNSIKNADKSSHAPPSEQRDTSCLNLPIKIDQTRKQNLTKKVNNYKTQNTKSYYFDDSSHTPTKALYSAISGDQL